jgi:hypothetical protein
MMYFKLVSTLKAFHPDGTWRLSKRRKISNSKELSRKTANTKEFNAFRQKYICLEDSFVFRSCHALQRLSNSTGNDQGSDKSREPLHRCGVRDNRLHNA